MGELREMPRIQVERDELVKWGKVWQGAEGSPRGDGQARNKRPAYFDKRQAMEFGRVFDLAFGRALAEMLSVAVVTPSARSLIPAESDCVEVGTTRVIGGIRPQNYDVAYRPDGPRIVFDSKTLNDESSIRKNWQNMINDLASEAATVHTRFPYCVVAFIVVLPKPALHGSQRRAISATLDRLGSRKAELDQHHLAEAIALVIWDPATGEIEPARSACPPSEVEDRDLMSNIHLDKMHLQVYRHYADRYQHLPPHAG